MPFLNREDAGRRLAQRLQELSLNAPIVIALPRGGVPIGAEIARTLKAPLDILVVRKIGAPGNPEYGIGAIAEEGTFYIKPRELIILEGRKDQIQKMVAQERDEVNRQVRIYRKHRPLTPVLNRDVVLVDDGLATGVTAFVAIQYLKRLGARRVILAVPVCARESASLLRSEKVQLVCLEEPEDFFSVGQWYQDFTQLSDEDVIRILSGGTPGPSRQRNQVA